MSKLHDKLWESGELSWKLHSGQMKIYNTIRDTKGDAVIVCSRRFGKSYMAAVMALEDAIRKPNARILVFAPTQKDAYDIFGNDIIPAITADAPDGLITRYKSDRIYKLSNGSQIKFFGFDTAKDAARGRGVDRIYIDEAGFAAVNDYEYVVKSVLSPMLLHSKGNVIYTTTPPKTFDHHFYKTWDAARQKGSAHTYTIYDNPILDASQIQYAIESCGGIGTVDFRREYLCERIVDGRSLIIQSFDPSVHVIPHHKAELVQEGGCWLIGDVGGIRDKTVLHIFGRLTADSRLVILDEVVLDPNTSSKTISKEIQRLMAEYSVPEFNTWIDAHGQTRTDIFHDSGLTCRMPPKLDRDSAISALNSAFYTDKLLMSDKCNFTKRSLQNCMFNENRTDFMRTEEFGHADAIMSIVYGYRVAKFVESVKPQKTSMFSKKSNESGIKKFANLFKAW